MLLRRLIRPLLAAPFVYDGISAATKPAEHVETARAALVKLEERTKGRVDASKLSDTQLTLAVRAHGGATAALGVCVGAGLAPRAAALALAGLTLPLAAANHPLLEKDKQARKDRVGPFINSVGRVGAALLAGIDTAGKPSVQYRVAQSVQHHRQVNAAVKAALAEVAA